MQSDIDMKQLYDIFLRANCLGLADLAQYLSTEEGAKLVHINVSLDLLPELPPEARTPDIENIHLRSEIGDYGVTPLEHLAQIAKLLSRYSKTNSVYLSMLDRACGDFAQSMRKPLEIVDVIEVTQGDLYPKHSQN
jgi:hypothetical protein